MCIVYTMHQDQCGTQYKRLQISQNGSCGLGSRLRANRLVDYDVSYERFNDSSMLEAALEARVAHGPVAAGIAVHENMFHYSKGDWWETLLSTVSH